jgi:hypothetical protein
MLGKGMRSSFELDLARHPVVARPGRGRSRGVQGPSVVSKAALLSSCRGSEARKDPAPDGRHRASEALGA